MGALLLHFPLRFFLMSPPAPALLSGEQWPGSSLLATGRIAAAARLRCSCSSLVAAMTE
jgi:hypothetical protein